MTEFILEARPERWKLFQVLPVRGQNDGAVDPHLVTADEFEHYVESARRVEVPRSDRGSGKLTT